MQPQVPPAVSAPISTEGSIEDAAPALWNPNAAASWSLIFSPIFGSIVQGRNWRALGETDKALASTRWTKISVVFFAIVVLFGFIMSDSKVADGISRIVGFALLISWYYANGKEQNAYVLARFGKDYKRKGWLKPLGLAVACLLGFFVVVVVIGFIAGAITGAA